LVDSEVLDLDVGILVYFLIDVCDLGGQLTDVSYANDLHFVDLGVHSEGRANREGARLARTVLALRDQVVEGTACAWLGDQRDGNSLDLRWLQKAKLFNDTLDHVGRDANEFIFLIP